MEAHQLSKTDLILMICDLTAELDNRVQADDRLSDALMSEAHHMAVIAESVAAFALNEILFAE